MKNKVCRLVSSLDKNAELLFVAFALRCFVILTNVDRG